MGSTRPLTATLALALVAPAAALGVGVSASPASAAPPTIVVDTWDDELNADGDCSIREAITTINTAADVDACIVPTDPVIEIPGPIETLAAPLTVTETMTIRGTAASPASLSCSFVIGNCIENVGAGSNLDLVNLWISMASGHQVYVAPGAGHAHLQDVNVWGGAGGVVSQGGDISLASSSVWDTGDWGVFSLNGDIAIDHSVLGGHQSGAVYADLADVSITSSAVYGNEGYGILGQSGQVQIVNTTIADNGADASRTHDGVVTFRSSTVTGNRRAQNITGPGETRFSNSVVADSALGNCNDAVTSDGFNVSDDATCSFGEATDRIGIDPGLAPFDPTAYSPSAPPSEGSALIDTGGDCLAVDQYDALRPTDGDGDGSASCDVGAVESDAVAGPPIDPAGSTDPAGPSTPLPAAPATAVIARPAFTG
jgi:CSLREA domain-containing protein